MVRFDLLLLFLLQYQSILVETVGDLVATARCGWHSRAIMVVWQWLCVQNLPLHALPRTRRLMVHRRPFTDHLRMKVRLARLWVNLTNQLVFVRVQKHVFVVMVFLHPSIHAVPHVLTRPRRVHSLSDILLVTTPLR